MHVSATYIPPTWDVCLLGGRSSTTGALCRYLVLFIVSRHVVGALSSVGDVVFFQEGGVRGGRQDRALEGLKKTERAMKAQPTPGLVP